jgi:D-arabinose 1-dehydrogenase-like Zn-dependent alcohol dehydrogenase
MRAYVVEHPAGVFRQVDLPRPAPSAGQVLLRVQASGVWHDRRRCWTPVSESVSMANRAART